MFEKVSEDVYAITDGSTVGNVALIATETGNFLIDTSMYPKVARDIRISVEKTKTGKLLGGAFTHYHFDHTGGSQIFHDVPMYGHALTKENFEKNYMTDEFLKRFKDSPQKDLFEGLRPTPPSRVYSTNPFVPEEFNNVEFIHTGGHTSGSILIRYIPENILFAGDNLFVGRYPWGGDPTASPYDWLNAMKTIQDMKPKKIVPGHGSVVDELTEINRYVKYLEKVIQLGEKLVIEKTDEEKALEALEEIDFLPESREGMKKGTLSRWFEVIKAKNS